MKYTVLGYPVAMPSYIPPVTAWLRHGPFAMWLASAARPRRIVELGSHYGFSYFAFCQAVAEAGIEADCFSVDTWQGDDHAGFYGEDVYQAVQRQNTAYRHFSTLLRKTFAEALADIEDGSVDLLHIDGRHSYEDVKEDFESWLPKLSDRAIVLFHDTRVTEREFGVWQLWAELEGTRPSFNFSHQHGLGVLFWGHDIPEGLRPCVDLLVTEAGSTLVVDAFETSAGLIVDQAADRAGSGEPSLGRDSSGHEAEWIDRLKRELQLARSKPARLIGQKLQFNALRLASTLTSSLSPRTSDRFAKSASKRDPFRNDLLKDRLAASDYDVLLEGWEALRREAPSPSLATTACKISLVVGATQTADPALVTRMLQSVRAQSHGQWELCIACPPALQDTIALHGGQEARIKLVPGDADHDETAALAAAASVVGGDYLMVLGAQDMLDPAALGEIAKTLQTHPTAKLIYTDEDQIDAAGKRFDPHFKPDWNPDLFYSWNYINAPVVLEAALWRRLDGLQAMAGGAALYDLILRASEGIEPGDVRHIAKVLYHVCAVRTEPQDSAALQDSARLALGAHLERRYGRTIPVENGALDGSFRVLWPLDQPPSVTIIMPTRDNAPILRRAVESLLDKTRYDQLELLIVNNGSVQQDSLDFFAEIQGCDARVRVIDDPRPFNYSALNNAAVAQSQSDVIVLLNDDVEITEPGWLSEMVALTLRPDVGCVGAKLHYPDGLIQHAGIIIGIGGVAAHGHLSYGRTASGYFGRLKHRQNYSALTGACLALRRDVFDQVKGLNETDLTVAFSDVDLCLKVQEAGYWNVWTPFAQLVHHESASRGADKGGAKRRRFREEIQYLQTRWSTRTDRDPAYNPNLTHDATDFSFAPPRWD